MEKENLLYRQRNNSSIKINLKYIFFIICFYLLIFQIPLENTYHIFKYTDEVLTIFFILFIFFNLLSSKKENKKLTNKEKLICISFLILNFIGILSSIFYKYQPVNFVLHDFISTNKFVIVFFGSFFTFKNIIGNKKYEMKINFHCKILSLFFFILSLLDIIFNIYDVNYATRYFLGIKSVNLMYGFSSYLSTTIFFLLMTLCLVTNEKNMKKNRKYIFMCLIVLLLTMRTRTLAFCAIFIFLIYYIIKKNKHINVGKQFVIALVLIIIAFNQLSFYFSSETARNVLLNKSIEIAKDHFPLGAGYATYGTQASADNYSIIYYMYDLTKTYGLGKNSHHFITDSFWPAIIGQFGFIGFLCYISYLIFLFLEVSEIKNDKYKYFTAFCIIIYLYISTISENIFSISTTTSLAIILGIIIKNDNRSLEVNL